MYRALDAPRSKFAMPPPPNRPNQAGRGGFCDTSQGNHNKRSRDDASETSGRTALSAVGSSSLQGSIQTSVISIRSSKHGRQRRHERNISKRQLQAAIKHGQRQRVRSDRFKYTHNGLVFITDTNGNEITSYFQSLDMPFRTVHRMSERDHYEAKVQMTQNAAAFCKSHSVLLVDTSGSMRNSDVQGSRTRLSAVWLAIAEDFVRNRIESHIASTRDAISIILMGEDAKVLMHQAPTDWITYNRILTIHKEGTILPAGHGCYGPALRKAQDILMEYETADCQLTMVVLSDGRPSDGSIIKGLNLSGAKEQFHQSVVYLSSRLGKRFTLRTIGMGAADQFETLQEMTHVANNYGSLGAFQLPSLSRSGLGAAMSSIATSLTESQSQTNNWMNDGQQRQMRKVLRENRKEIPLLTEEVNADEFTIYRDEHVTHMEFIDDMFQERPLQNEGAKGVAIKKVAFGEGTERNAFQFFEVAADNKTVVGKPLVAKESRYVMDTYGPEAVAKMDKFVRRFCRIQRQAAKTAEAFNAKLDTIQNLDSETARVSVLPCSVYYVNEPSRGGRIPYIVEPRIPPEDFEKWNSNNGWIQSKTKKMAKMQARVPNLVPLVGIKEEDEDDDDDDDLEEDNEQENAMFFQHGEVAQAFSHFSYVHGGRKTLICDLQGAYNRQRKLLELTDPVIHYFDPSKDHRRAVYGRTDRGDKGISDFLQNHDCNGLCDLVCKGFFTPTKIDGAKRQKATAEGAYRTMNWN